MDSENELETNRRRRNERRTFRSNAPMSKSLSSTKLIFEEICRYVPLFDNVSFSKKVGSNERSWSSNPRSQRYVRVDRRIGHAKWFHSKHQRQREQRLRKRTTDVKNHRTGFVDLIRIFLWHDDRRQCFSSFPPSFTIWSIKYLSNGKRVLSDNRVTFFVSPTCLRPSYLLFDSNFEGSTLWFGKTSDPSISHLFAFVSNTFRSALMREERWW